MSPRPCTLPRSSTLLPANQPTTNHAGPLGLARSFEMVKVELFDVPADAVVPADVDVPRSARTVLRTAKQLATLLPDLATLGDFDLRPVRRLRFYAGAALYMHLLVLADGADDLSRLAMRDAAFALFVRAHQHCRRGVMRLRWVQSDAGAYLPPLWQRKPWMIAGAEPRSMTATDAAVDAAIEAA